MGVWLGLAYTTSPSPSSIAPPPLYHFFPTLLHLDPPHCTGLGVRMALSLSLSLARSLALSLFLSFFLFFLSKRRPKESALDSPPP